MKTKIIILFVTLTIIIIGITAGIMIHFFNQADTENQEKIGTALTWSQMDPLPESAEGFIVRTMGSPASQEFIITFTAAPEDIDMWINNSIGTKDVTPSKEDFELTYPIKPLDAKFAQIVVNTKTNDVTIHVYLD